MSSEQVEMARSMMALMPTEVFDALLGKLIEEGTEWPFNTPEETLMGTEWYRILFPFNLASLRRLNWKRKSVRLASEKLFPGSSNDIDLLRRNLTTNEIRLLGMDPEPYRRQVLQNCGFIRENGRLRSEPILGVTELGLKIFDGNQRIAAVYELGLESTMEISAWVGEIT